jgi:hypothetical protein
MKHIKTSGWFPHLMWEKKKWLISPLKKYNKCGWFPHIYNFIKSDWWWLLPDVWCDYIFPLWQQSNNFLEDLTKVKKKNYSSSVLFWINDQWFSIWMV